jgi:hypothetical protein
VVPTAGQEAGQAGRGAQFGGFGALAAGDLNGLVEPCLRIAGSAPARCQQEFAAEAVDLRLPATRSVRLSGRWGSRLAVYRCGGSSGIGRRGRAGFPLAPYGDRHTRRTFTMRSSGQRPRGTCAKSSTFDSEPLVHPVSVVGVPKPPEVDRSTLMRCRPAP